MQSTSDSKFKESTRGKVVDQLRGGEKTVDEIAITLGLTDNAIRGHIAALERDGLVTTGLPRKAVTKPAVTWILTPAAERFYPKAYGTILNRLLRVLTDRRPKEEVDELLHSVGEELPTPAIDPAADIVDRARQAAEYLNALGGAAKVEIDDGVIVIVGTECPLSAAVEATPNACNIAESLLAKAIGNPVRQVCDTGSPPRCCFVVSPESN